MNCACMSVGKPGNGAVDKRQRLQRPVGADLDAVVVEFDHQPGLGERVGDRQHVVGPRADQVDRAAGDSRRAGIAAGLDAVGHDVVGRAVQALDAVDDQMARADAVDLRAHRHQQVAQVDDLRLARGIEQLRPAGRQHRRHQRIFGRADRDHREAEVAARQPALGRARLDVAGGELDLGADALRAPADAGRSAGRRSRSRRAATRSLRRRAPASAPAPGSRRASCGPCRRARRSRRSRSAWSVIRRPNSPFLTPATVVETPSWLSRWPEVVDVGEPRQVAQRQLLIGQQRAGQQRQRGILGAGDRDLALRGACRPVIQMLSIAAL